MPKEIKKNNRGFETKIEELESIAKILENGESDLDSSIKLFEKATKLLAQSKSMLTNTQRRMDILIEESGEWTAENDDLSRDTER